ncbi:MAG: hypothetical protein D6780_00410 [Candidatus Dadabacteria bacterium]|nr:MAG: hypothetical protein D6780_00410 [Candidatus Dadabacteria bacterium]
MDAQQGVYPEGTTADIQRKDLRVPSDLEARIEVLKTYLEQSYAGEVSKISNILNKFGVRKAISAAFFARMVLYSADGDFRSLDESLREWFVERSRERVEGLVEVLAEGSEGVSESSLVRLLDIISETGKSTGLSYGICLDYFSKVLQLVGKKETDLLELAEKFNTVLVELSLKAGKGSRWSVDLLVRLCYVFSRHSSDKDCIIGRLEKAKGVLCEAINRTGNEAKHIFYGDPDALSGPYKRWGKEDVLELVVEKAKIGTVNGEKALDNYLGVLIEIGAKAKGYICPVFDVLFSTLRRYERPLSVYALRKMGIAIADVVSTKYRLNSRVIIPSGITDIVAYCVVQLVRAMPRLTPAGVQRICCSVKTMIEATSSTPRSYELEKDTVRIRRALLSVLERRGKKLRASELDEFVIDFTKELSSNSSS